ncbi:MAG: hypothetical protein ACYS9X_26440 [Planctomycetota bacterium]|jgi:hypothetical protein
MARRLPWRNALQTVSGVCLCAAAGLAGEPAPPRRDETASLTRLSEARKKSLLYLLREATPAERQRLLSAWSLAGVEVLDVFLEFARSELAAGRTESWPELLRYFHGVLDRDVDLLVLEVLDLEVPDETKVDALALLNHHLMMGPWVLRAEIRGETIELPTMRGGGTLSWGPIVKEGRPVFVDDALRIRDRVTRLVEEGRADERLRQHARELLAVIAYRDALADHTRRRARVLRGELQSADEITEDFKRWNKGRQAAEQKTVRKWNEERAKTQALEAALAASDDTPAGGLDSGGANRWPCTAVGFAGGVILGAIGSWLVLRRRARSGEE